MQGRQGNLAAEPLIWGVTHLCPCPVGKYFQNVSRGHAVLSSDWGNCSTQGHLRREPRDRETGTALRARSTQ